MSPKVEASNFKGHTTSIQAAREIIEPYMEPLTKAHRYATSGHERRLTRKMWARLDPSI